MKRHAADPAIESRRKVPPPADTDPAIEALVQDIIAKVADKWTMLILEVLEEHGTLRFTQIGRLVGNISQKMLTKTLRQMESDGLVRRTVRRIRADAPPEPDLSWVESLATDRPEVPVVRLAGPAEVADWLAAVRTSLSG